MSPDLPIHDVLDVPDQNPDEDEQAANEEEQALNLIDHGESDEEEEVDVLEGVNIAVNEMLQGGFHVNGVINDPAGALPQGNGANAHAQPGAENPPPPNQQPLPSPPVAPIPHPDQLPFVNQILLDIQPHIVPLQIALAPQPYIHEQHYFPHHIPSHPPQIPVGLSGVPLYFTTVMLPYPNPIPFLMPVILQPLLPTLLEEAALDNQPPIPFLCLYVRDFLDMRCLRARVYRNRHLAWDVICGSCFFPEDFNTYVEEVCHSLQLAPLMRPYFCDRCGRDPFVCRRGTECRHCMTTYFHGENRQVIHIDNGSLRVLEPLV